MSNQITGRVLSIGQPLQVAGNDPSRPIIKRELIIDCTRHDPYTGERSKFENTPLLEFTGDGVRMLDGFKCGDIVTVTFDVVGTKYTDKSTHQPKIFTRVRPYRIEMRTQQSFDAPQMPPQPSQQPATGFYGQQQATMPQQGYAQPQAPQNDLFGDNQPPF